MATSLRKIAIPKRARRTIYKDSVKGGARRRLYPVNPFRWDQWEDLAPVPLRDFAGRFRWPGDPKNFHHRNPLAPRCTGGRDSRVNMCNFAVSDGRTATAPGPRMHCELIRDKRRWSYSARRLGP